MPITTRDKRASAIACNAPIPPIWPLADGSIVAGDRRAMLGYRGFLAPPTPPLVSDYNIRASMLSLHGFGRVFPYPDGSLTFLDREHILMYRLGADPVTTSALVVTARHSLSPVINRNSVSPPR